MFAYFSPLAPAVCLLLSAFILPQLIKRVAHPFSQRFSGLTLLAITGLVLLLTRLNASAQTLSSWSFTTPEATNTIILQLTHLNFTFLGLTWWLLLIAFLMTLPSAEEGRAPLPYYPLWLTLGGTASLVFVSSNELTLAYSILAFDLCSAVYWLYRQDYNLALARLFLGIFTAFAITIALTFTLISPITGLYLMGAAMWLRLLLYPIMELDQPLSEGGLASLNHFIYFSLTLAVNVYIITALFLNPLPTALRWLIVLTMLWQGLLVWLKPHTAYKAALIRLIFNQTALLLLIDPLATETVIAYAVGLILSLAALWVTPRLSKPTFTQAGLYLAAITATLTLLGSPFSLSWSVNLTVYHLLFQSITPHVGLAIIAIIAQGLVLSSLMLYWQFIFYTQEERSDELPAIPRTHWVANILTWLPWLIPGIGIISLSALLQSSLPLIDFSHTTPVFVALALTWSAGGGLGYYRPEILAYLRVSERSLTSWLTIRWFTDGLKQLENLSKLFLQIQVILEGKHYLAWTFFIALVGFLAVLLQ